MLLGLKHLFTTLSAQTGSIFTPRQMLLNLIDTFAPKGAITWTFKLLVLELMRFSVWVLIRLAAFFTLKPQSFQNTQSNPGHFLPLLILSTTIRTILTRFEPLNTLGAEEAFTMEALFGFVDYAQTDKAGKVVGVDTVLFYGVF